MKTFNRILELGDASLSWYIKLSFHIALLLSLTLFTSTQSFADDTQIYIGLDPTQCSDEEKYRFIFIVDNSGSMSSTEFTQAKGTVDAAIQTVLASDLNDVQVSVMQYGTNHDSPNNHAYDVTVPFTSNATVATNWSRHYGRSSPNPRFFQDHLPGSLAEARLDNIYGPGGELDVTDGTNLQVVFFTDAWRTFGPTYCCSVLTADSNDTFRKNALLGFGEYNVMKNGSLIKNSSGEGLKAQFTVLNTNTRASARNAAAAVASVGGEYVGGVEANTGDPDGSQATPRRFISTSFSDPNLAAKLVSLVIEVIEEIKSSAFTQSAPAVTVNAFNQLINREQLYYSLFDPELGPKWDGNIKGYKITAGSDILSSDGSNAIDPDTGSLSAEAKSFWSEGGYEECGDGSDASVGLTGCTLDSDGSEASVGAFRDRLTKARTIYTQKSVTDTSLHVDGEPDDTTDQGTGRYSETNGNGVLQLTASSLIDKRLLNVESSVDTFDRIEADVSFDVIQGTAFSYIPPSESLTYNDSGIFGNQWNQVAQSPSFSEYTDDLTEPFSFNFSYGVPGAVIDPSSLDEGRLVIGLRSSNEAGFTNFKRATIALQFQPNGTLRLRYRRTNNQDRFKNIGSYSNFDDFAIKVVPPTGGGANYSFEISQNGTVVDTVTDAQTWGNAPIPEGDAFSAIAVGRANNILGSNELTGFFNLTFVQERDVDVTIAGQLTRTAVLGWMLGDDVFNERGDDGDTEGNRFVADSLHSRPRVVTYGGTASNPNDVLFHTTNLGMLHAIDPADGKELWSYIPAEMLGNASKYIRDDETVDEHIYGLDGQLSTWIIRPPRKAGSSVIEDPLRVFLYMGQRRGGKSIYAFNATNALGNTSADPEVNDCGVIGDGKDADPICLLFPPIIGGSDLNSTPGFGMLGQTWGRPQRVRINTDDALFCKGESNTPCKRDLLLVSGGYDVKYDGVGSGCGGSAIAGARATVEELAGCVVGAHLYMVDPFTGELVWSMGSFDPGVSPKPGKSDDIFVDCPNPNSVSDTSGISDSEFATTGDRRNGLCNDKMEHSFVSTPVTLDLDSDGAIDTIFTNDISGKVWRIDFRQDSTDPEQSAVRLLEKSTGGIIADLSRDGNSSINRYFYNSIDASILFGSELAGSDDTTLSRINLVVGSGNRANPRSPVDTNEGNQFFTVFDTNVTVAPDNYSYVSENLSGASVPTLRQIDLQDLPSFTNADANNNLLATEQYGAQFELDNQTDEKILAPTLTFNGFAIGVSYSPGLDSGTQCTLGGSQLYIIDLRTGERRTVQLKQQGIVAEAVLLNLIDDQGTADVGDDTIEKTICVGTECFKDEGGNGGLGVDDDGAELGKAIKSGWWEVSSEAETSPHSPSP